MIGLQAEEKEQTSTYWLYEDLPIQNPLRCSFHHQEMLSWTVFNFMDRQLEG